MPEANHDERAQAGDTATAVRRLAVSGASGLVGARLCADLSDGEMFDVYRLVRDRTEAGSDAVYWSAARGEVDTHRLEGMDAVVHLAGENIAEGRWSRAKKRAIRDSRVKGTRTLSEAVARLERKPSVLVSASAVGWYGDRGDEVLDETSGAGEGFLSDVCREWEAAADAARDAGIRVVHLRFGVVLSAEGGALAKMLTPFKMGVGGRLGNGRQYVSWIWIGDLVRVIRFALEREDLSGAVNAVGPEPVTNRELTTTLAGVLEKPAAIPVPAFSVKLMFGEMGEALLLSSARVLPRRLTEAGFTFEQPTLEGALRAELK